MPGVFINCYLLSLNLELINLARLAGKQAPGIFQVWLPSTEMVTEACDSPDFDVGSSGSDSGAPHACNKHFTY